MREYRPKLQEMGIGKWEYEELRAFCRQYPEKKAQAAALLGIRGGSRVQEAKDERGHEIGVVMPPTVRISSPTAEAAIKRVMLLKDCDMIDGVARLVGDGQWERALILNICYGVGYNFIDPAILPTSGRNAYFAARREFFFRLYNERILQGKECDRG